MIHSGLSAYEVKIVCLIERPLKVSELKVKQGYFTKTSFGLASHL